MPALTDNFFDFSVLDRLSYRDSPIHRLDSRAKVLTTLVFVVIVASYDKYAVVSLLPLALFPLVILFRARLPLGIIFKRLLIVAPFAVLIGIFNPIFDQQVIVRLGEFEMTGGWVSFASILVRFALTVGSALILVAVSSFPAICHALGRLGVPWVFALQLMFLYRYIFVLGDEAMRMVRARALRSFGGRKHEFRVFGAMLTQLLWRTLERARRVHQAMLSRCFEGEIRILNTDRFGWKDALFVVGWSSLFVVLRICTDADIVRCLLEGSLQT